ncbi:MAG: uracil-DNA glycosylase [Chlamydiota bacterium]
METLERKCSLDLEPSWHEVLKGELQKPYVQELIQFVDSERNRGEMVYPPEADVFSALWKTPFHKVRVVIMGQDPYHGSGQAHGMCFSVNKGVSIPPSLKNIFIELQNDVGIPIPKHGCLESWAEQGVLLLNATLTVTESNPMSHHGKGWERFTDAIVYSLLERNDPIIFLLWGKSAQDKCNHIRAKSNHRILTAAHPSPLSAYRGFFGCRHFSKVNEMVVALGGKPIDWRI